MRFPLLTREISSMIFLFKKFEEELSLILLKEQEPRQSFFQRWIGGSKK